LVGFEFFHSLFDFLLEPALDRVGEERFLGPTYGSRRYQALSANLSTDHLIAMTKHQRDSVPAPTGTREAVNNSEFCTSQVIADETANYIARSLDAVIRAIKLLQDHPVPDNFLGRQPDFVVLPHRGDSSHEAT